VPDARNLMFIDCDYAKCGASAERKPPNSKWEKDLGALPRHG
jgi:hypothetical protein